MRQVNCDDCTQERVTDVNDVEPHDNVDVDPAGKNSAPIVAGVSRVSLRSSIVSSGTDASSSSSSPMLLMVLRTVWLTASLSRLMRSLGLGEPAGLGVEILDICFLSCRNLWNLASEMLRMLVMLTASLSIVSRLSMMIIMIHFPGQR